MSRIAHFSGEIQNMQFLSMLKNHPFQMVILDNMVAPYKLQVRI